jgi:hypothetical protein
MKWRMREENYELDLDIQICRDVDRTLYLKEYVITSDSVILDHCVSWANLTAECMRRTGKRAIRVWYYEDHGQRLSCRRELQVQRWE